MTEAASATTFVVGDQLPWPDDLSASDERGPLDEAAIFITGSRTPCAIRKISALGVAVSSDLTPALGERVAVELATGQRPTGKIAWIGRGELGVLFEMEPRRLTRCSAQHFRSRAPARKRGAAGDRDLCVGVRRRAEHSGRRGGLAAGQACGDQSLRRAELDVDYPMDSADDPQGRRLRSNTR
jgi:hypothetical protein